MKIKKSEKDWLLIKERDAWATKDPEELPPESVLSGLTVEELGEGGDRGEAVRRELIKLGATRRRVEPKGLKVMLAETADRPFTKPDWIFEPKLDGYRVLASRSGGEPLLLTRNGNDYGATFPEVVRAMAALPFDRLVLDGEVVAMDEQGKPSFQRLQTRGMLRRPLDVRQAAVNTPVTYYAFDLLGFEDFDLRSLPLTARKQVLRKVIPPVGALRYLEHVEEEGEAALRGDPAARPRGHRREEGGLALQGRALVGLAQDPGAQDRRLRGRGIHRAEGLPRRLRRTAAGASTSAAS